jgi:isoquinoline 1-oxidoreductase subunit beta
MTAGMSASLSMTYLCDYAYHAQMEPLNAVASVSAAGDSAEVWCGTQSQTMALEATANVLGLDRGKVKRFCADTTRRY